MMHKTFRLEMCTTVLCFTFDVVSDEDTRCHLQKKGNEQSGVRVFNDNNSSETLIN